jgi:hypothetical protein
VARHLGSGQGVGVILDIELAGQRIARWQAQYPTPATSSPPAFT